MAILVFVVLMLGVQGLPGMNAVEAVSSAGAQQQTLGSQGEAEATATAGEDSFSTGCFTLVTYKSSVDGTLLRYLEYLPAGYDPSVAYPVALLLHGASVPNYDYFAFNLSVPGHLFESAADSHGYILLAVEARAMRGYPTNRNTFYVDGPLAPGEQDILDILPSLAQRRRIDPQRIYLAGYSMGGVGSWGLASRNPGIFAAIAPGAPATDLFQGWTYIDANMGTITPWPPPSVPDVIGGMHGQSALTDTYWYENSPRFIMPNMMHTPLFVIHGTLDEIIPNNTLVWPYMQSRHVVDTPGFTDSRGRAITMQELRAEWPGSYYEEHLWPPTEHSFTTPEFYLPDSILTFFDSHPLDPNPLSVAFTTYEDRHTRAYWLQLHLTHPWTATPGLVYATRDPAANAVTLQVAGSMTITLDMQPMGLTSVAPLTLVVEPRPAATLAPTLPLPAPALPLVATSTPTPGPAPAGDLALVLSGRWPVGRGAGYMVTQDGVPLSTGAYRVEASRFTLYRRPTDGSHTYVIKTSGGATPTSTATPSPTPSFTPTPVPALGGDGNYLVAPSSGATVVQGTQDVGNHCDDCTTTIGLPFPYKLYGTTYTSVDAGSNGTLQFASSWPYSPFANIYARVSCLPHRILNQAIVPYWHDLDTSVGVTSAFDPGIYTSVSGNAPHRIFNIEWRAAYFRHPLVGGANFEVRLYEGQDRFDIIYGEVTEGSGISTIGVQKDACCAPFLATEWTCNGEGNPVAPGLELAFSQPPYGTPTPTGTPPTATATSSPSNTPTGTLTPTATSAPCSVCNLEVSQVAISCNPDGTVRWAAMVHNSGNCTVAEPWQAQLQARTGSGGYMGVASSGGTGTFAPGDTSISGDLCYVFSPGTNAMRVEFGLGDENASCKSHAKSAGRPPCNRTASCP
jgi:hypothetical protein